MSTNSLVGTQIGNYQIKELIGQGGMGSVYLGEHPRIGRRTFSSGTWRSRRP